jgi:hypothetical protein
VGFAIALFVTFISHTWREATESDPETAAWIRSHVRLSKRRRA